MSTEHEESRGRRFRPDDMDKVIAKSMSPWLHPHKVSPSRERSIQFLGAEGGRGVRNDGLRFYLPNNGLFDTYGDDFGTVEGRSVQILREDFVRRAEAEPNGIIFGSLNEERLRRLQAVFSRFSRFVGPLENWHTETYEDFLREARYEYDIHPIAGDGRIDYWTGRQSEVENGMPVTPDTFEAIDAPMSFGEGRLADRVRVYRNGPDRTPLQVVRVQIPFEKKFYFEPDSQKPDAVQMFRGGDKYGTPGHMYLLVGQDRITALEASKFESEWRVDEGDGRLRDSTADDFVWMDSGREKITSTPVSRAQSRNRR